MTTNEILTTGQRDTTVLTTSIPTDSTTAGTNNPQPITPEHRKVLAGSMVGTTIEWFDFFIYAQAAGLIFATQYFNPASLVKLPVAALKPVILRPAIKDIVSAASPSSSSPCWAWVVQPLPWACCPPTRRSVWRLL